MQTWKWVSAALFVGLVAAVLGVPKAEFLLGGAMVNVGYRMQDRLDAFDFQHEEDITPTEVWNELKAQNELSAAVRAKLPRTTRHPLVALLVCMDARIDTNELTGDTRHDYYIVRTAGSVMGPYESDMLELAVANGVKVVVLTRHSDCAAEKASRDPVARAKYPALVEGVDTRDQRVKEFLARPAVAARIASGELLVKEMLIDTSTGDLQQIAAQSP